MCSGGRRFCTNVKKEAGEPLTLAHLEQPAAPNKYFHSPNLLSLYKLNHPNTLQIRLEYNSFSGPSFHLFIVHSYLLLEIRRWKRKRGHTRRKLATFCRANRNFECTRGAHFIKAITHLLRRCVCTFFDIIMRMQTRRLDSKHELTILTFIFLSVSCIPARLKVTNAESLQRDSMHY